MVWQSSILYWIYEKYGDRTIYDQMVVNHGSRLLKCPCKGNHSFVDKSIYGNLISIIFVEGEMKSSLVIIETRIF